MFKQWCFLVLCVFCTASQAEEFKKKPVVYLTFDDGPSSDEVTESLLHVLAVYNARATFFVTGERARANPEKIPQIVGSGHALGNHTMSHGHLTKLYDHEVIEELMVTNRHVLDAGGPAMSCFRAPFGDTSQRVNDIASNIGLSNVGWTIDTRDWDTFVDPEHIAVQLEDSQSESIVLMHDGPKARWRTLEVFSRWMEDNAGIYKFEALPECLQPESYASLDQSSDSSSAFDVVNYDSPKGSMMPAVMEEPQTMDELLGKLRSYKLSLEPEVVAQNSIENSDRY